MRRQISPDHPLLKAAELARGSHDFVTMVFCDSKYKRLLDNWLLHVEAIGEIPILVCALDAELASEMSARGYHACPISWSGSLSELWRIRAVAINLVLGTGVGVLHSDVDAVWLRSPIPFISQCPDADMIASQGTLWPPTALSRWGHVLCFGFSFFRATDATSRVMKSLADFGSSQERFDDQKAFNELLLVCNTNWQKAQDGYELSFGDRQFRCYHETLLGQATLPDGSQIRVGLLPHKLFRRCQNDVEQGPPVVAHPLARKSGEHSEDELRRLGYWKLKD